MELLSECYSVVVQIVLDFFFFQAEDGIRDLTVTGVQTCALPISPAARPACGEGPPPARCGGRHWRTRRPTGPARRPHRLPGTVGFPWPAPGELSTDRKSVV